MWHDHMWNGQWMMGWGFIPMLLFWGFVIGVAIYFVQALSAKDEDKSSDSSVQLLKDRMASGDIDQKEFDTLLKKIKDA